MDEKTGNILKRKSDSLESKEDAIASKTIKLDEPNNDNKEELAKFSDLDPYYHKISDTPPTVTGKLRQVEHQAKASVAAKIIKIVDKEFSVSFSQKESQLETIDERILKIRKSLHLVRYGAVKSYYSPVQPKQTQTNPDSASLHPAIRRILGGKLPKTTKNDPPESITGSALNENLSKSVNLREETEIPQYVPPNKKHDPFSPSVPRGSQYKYKKRFVIGNVSKWIPVDGREDAATHKWMVYVRGDKDQADVSGQVHKVRFLLHPSYHPHDLVEVKDPPFQLTRRGWGEFPVRVQIFFHNKDDKAIDVIHHLKLDKTYTGLQTLGAETNVDVWLHNPNWQGRDHQENKDFEQSSEKKEKINNLFENLGSEGFVIRHSTTQSMRTELAPVETDSALAKEKCSHSVSVKIESSTPSAESSPKTTFIKCSDKTGKVFYIPITLLPNNKEVKVSGVQAPIKLQDAKTSQNDSLLSQARPSVTQEPIAAAESSSGVKHNIGEFNNDLENGKISAGLEQPSCSSQMSLDCEKPSCSSQLPPRELEQPWSSQLARRSSDPPSQPIVVVRGGQMYVVQQQPRNLAQVQAVIHQSDLEKRIPGSSLEEYEPLLGKRTQELQLEAEARQGKKGINLVKKQSDYLVFLYHKIIKRKIEEFRNVEECVRYIAKYLPVVTSHASDISYRCIHPYSAATIQEFSSWNVGKQRSSGWILAKTISQLVINIIRNSQQEKRSLLKKEASEAVAWSCKTTYNWLRSHAFIPNVTILKDPSPEMQHQPTSTPLSSVTRAVLRLDNVIIKETEPVEVRAVPAPFTAENQKSTGPGLKTKVKRTHLVFPEDNKPEFGFVSETAKQLGISFEQEQISEDVWYPAAQKVLFTAVKTMAERIIRGAHAEGWDSRDNWEVGVKQVFENVKKDPTLSILTNKYLGSNDL